MSSKPVSKRGRLVLLGERYAEVERLLAYETGRQVLGVPLAMQQLFGLRAEPFQVLLVIMLASVQRFIRTPRPDPAYFDLTPLPDVLTSRISRRRIADALGIPVETVRRHVETLIARGLVVEEGRGKLTTPPGILKLLADEGIPRSAAAQSLAFVNLMLRYEAARYDDVPPDSQAFQDDK